MQNLADMLRDIAAGVARLSLKEVAVLAQKLTAKQIRQSFDLRQTPDGEPWAPLKRPSFAGVLKASHRHLLGQKKTGVPAFYGHDDLSANQQESFLSLAAIRDISNAKVTDEGFETYGRLPRYWEWQDQGTKRTGFGPPIPAREFWGFSEDTLELIGDLLADRMVNVIATVGVK